ncbi:c-Myc-binding protein-like isoform X1 [Hydractinia symbiolongicarpus]|uniref:c-Myc-binding protein-like isoform X1 n=1 Tax=Hydractinia symbiolongicarpus TaxID=13093 RepID=UPI00254D963D|nr:c-Myc-binding protein-like isoform X1 [Hydractinia symbiolongicarpus]
MVNSDEVKPTEINENNENNEEEQEETIRPADSKREEFRKYLEKSGVLDSLTKVLVTLYEEPEKPSSAVDFLKQHIGVGPPDTADVASLKLEMSKLKERNQELEDEVAELKQKVEELEVKNEDEKSS